MRKTSNATREIWCAIYMLSHEKLINQQLTIVPNKFTIYSFEFEYGLLKTMAPSCFGKLLSRH